MSDNDNEVPELDRSPTPPQVTEEELNQDIQDLMSDIEKDTPDLDDDVDIAGSLND
ncbi:12596_t:CDS:2 [Acaulospora morrowiae]|uniref:12596_t:CDS:1 n=1 Tax=Acaulospora morrowiae TaxID=94023 RepID=A0A9N8VJ69_9GLOM|nr:12596_t:CDS:2 [Acaulospora morrowiae]